MAVLSTALIHHKQMSTYVQPSDFVFSSSTGRPFNPDSLRASLKAALRTMGIALPPREDGLHLLRHSSGSLVYLRTGGDVKLTQAWLGHSKWKTTLDTYIHLLKGHEERTAQILEQGIFASPEVPGTVN